MAISNKPQQVGLSDPHLVRQENNKLAQDALIAKGKPTIIGETAVLPSTTVSATPTSVTATTSANNQVADTTTVYQTNGAVYVSTINETIQQVTNKNIVNQIGVTNIVAGTNVTITSTDGNGAGTVTINATAPTLGNISVINLDGNGSNVLHGNGYWSPDLTTYSNSNVVSLMAAFGSNTIVTTGNANVGNLISTGVVKVSGASAYFDAGVGYIQNGGMGEFQLSTAGATQPLQISTNSASKNWFFYANGKMTAPGNIAASYFIGNGSQLTSLPAPTVAQDITTTGDMSIMTYDGNLKYVSYATVEPSSGNLKAGNISTNGNITGGNLMGPLANGNSNVRIATANGNVTITAVGNTTMTISGTGANITGTANVTGNANVGNLGTATAIITTGNITTINSGLLQNGTSNVTITSGANISTFIGGNATAQFIVTATGANIAGYANIVGNVTVSNLIGPHANGNSNVNIPAANGNVNISAVGNANILVVTGTGANITGTANVSGNANVGNIGAFNGVFSNNISGNTNGFAIGYLNIPQVAASNTTIALTDAGKHYYSTTAGNFTLTIPANATTSFATGTAISIVVQAAGNILVNAAVGVTLYMAGNSTAANRAVGTYGMATVMKVATDTWFINGTGVS
jgi:hypothetical protein